MNENKNWFINLHSHTLYITSGDKDVRNLKNPRNLDNQNGEINDAIYYENFFNRLIESNIRINAITNHNIFDINQYEGILKFQQEQPQERIKEILVIPGIEYSVIFKKNKFHMIIISNPNKYKTFNEITKNIRKKMIQHCYIKNEHDIKNIKDRNGKQILDSRGELVSYAPMSVTREDNLVIELSNDMEIQEFFSQLSALNPIVTFHYGDKDPAISKYNLKKFIKIIEEVNKNTHNYNENILSGIITLIDAKTYKSADYYAKEGFKTILSADNPNLDKNSFDSPDSWKDNNNAVTKAIYGESIDSYYKLRFFLKYYNLTNLNMSTVTYFDLSSDYMDKLIYDYSFDSKFINELKKIKIPESNLTLIYGEKGSGKSLILNALFIYFNLQNKKVVGYNLDRENSNVENYLKSSDLSNDNQIEYTLLKYEKIKEQKINEYKNNFLDRIKLFNDKYKKSSHKNDETTINKLITSYIKEGSAKKIFYLKEHFKHKFLHNKYNFRSENKKWNEITKNISPINKTSEVSYELFKSNMEDEKIRTDFFSKMELKFIDLMNRTFIHLIFTDFYDNTESYNGKKNKDNLYNCLGSKQEKFNLKFIFDKIRDEIATQFDNLFLFIDIFKDFNIFDREKNIEIKDINGKEEKFGFIDLNKELFCFPVVTLRNLNIKDREQLQSVKNFLNSIANKNKIDTLKYMCYLKINENLFNYNLCLLYKDHSSVNESLIKIDGLSTGQKSFFWIKLFIRKKFWQRDISYRWAGEEFWCIDSRKIHFK